MVGRPFFAHPKRTPDTNPSRGRGGAADNGLAPVGRMRPSSLEPTVCQRARPGRRKPEAIPRWHDASADQKKRARTASTCCAPGLRERIEGEPTSTDTAPAAETFHNATLRKERARRSQALQLTAPYTGGTSKLTMASNRTLAGALLSCPNRRCAICGYLTVCSATSPVMAP